MIILQDLTYSRLLHCYCHHLVCFALCFLLRSVLHSCCNYIQMSYDGVELGFVGCELIKD